MFEALPAGTGSVRALIHTTTGEIMTVKEKSNVVDFLVGQHAEIRKLLDQVEKRHGKARAEAFDRLRYLLAVHETAEEEIVHPFARRTINNGPRVIDARLKEENKAKHVLQELEEMDVGSDEFEARFDKLRKAVLDHAEHEEHTEFPQIAAKSTPEQLRGMSAAVRAAEAIAPTHPHPGTESPTKNIVFGPFAAVADRTRDAIRKAMS
jgi:hemerythrin superfamily protein